MVSWVEQLKLDSRKPEMMMMRLDLGPADLQKFDHIGHSIEELSHGAVSRSRHGGTGCTRSSIEV